MLTLMLASDSASSTSRASPYSSESQPVPADDHSIQRDKMSNDDLVCPICQEVFFCPVKTICGHHFCSGCLTVWCKDFERPSCPLCRADLRAENTSTSGSSSGSNATPSFRSHLAFVVDRELEVRARDLLGPNAYRARALESVETKLRPKVEAYRHKVEKLSGSIDLALAALGSTAVTAGVSTTAAGAAAYASTYVSVQMAALSALASGSTSSAGAAMVSADALAHAAWWTASAEVASTSVAVGAAVGLGAAAFMGGMKMAAWLDDKGRYCILEEPGVCPEANRSASIRVYVQNLLPATVKVCLWAAKRKRRRKPQGIIERSVHAVAVASGIREEVQHQSAWQLEPRGECLSEKTIDIGAEAFLEVPKEFQSAWESLRASDVFLGGRDRKQYLVISVTFPGVVFDKDLGWCKARRGRRYLVCEVDGLTREKLVQEAGLASATSGEELQGDELEQLEEVTPSQQGMQANAEEATPVQPGITANAEEPNPRQSDIEQRRASLTADFL